ncbi:MAG: RNase P subunit p30 family protein [Halodesulfurarchaeum sp.]
MYEGVLVESNGSTTASRFATTAARLGFDGVVIRNIHQMMGEFDREKIGRVYDIDVVSGIEIVSDDRTEASGYIGSYRPETTILILRGGNPEINRFAAEHEQIDVLADPMGRDGDLNHVIVAEATNNDVHVEVSLAPMLRHSGGQRVRALRSLRKLRELIEAYDAPYVVSAGATNHLQMRAPRELKAVGAEIGFEPEDIGDGLRAWKTIARRNRERLSPEYVQPGVRRDPHPSDNDE